MAATGFVPSEAPLTLDAVAFPDRVRTALEHQLQVVGAEKVRQLRVVLHETELELGRMLERQRAFGPQAALAESTRRLAAGEDAFIAAFLQDLEQCLASGVTPAGF